MTFAVFKQLAFRSLSLTLLVNACAPAQPPSVPEPEASTTDLGGAPAGPVGVPPGAAPCNNINYHWSNTQPRVNVRHVFCGEIAANNQPKGFHSSVHLQASTVVTQVTNPVPGVTAGTYNATVHFAAPANPTSKMSTFFPDACSEAQVTTSIVYAANNQTGPAQPWGQLGPSGPLGADNTYCLDTNNAPFTIRMGLLQQGDVNTAFPN
jgi:hypothetical protein